MSRIDENQEMREAVGKSLTSYYDSSRRFSDMSIVSMNMISQTSLLMDISNSLAVIADALTGKTPDDKPKAGCYIWHYATELTPQKHERVILITQNGIEYEAYFENNIWHTNEGTSFTTEYVKLWRLIGGED